MADMARVHPLRADPRLAHARDKGRTLGQLVALKVALVAVCRRCKHRRVLYPAALIERFGPDMPAIDLRQHLRCSACRYRSANLHESSR
jgi:hypothetical protein